MQNLRYLNIFLVLFYTANNGFAQLEIQDPGFDEDMFSLYYHAVDENIAWAVGGRFLDQPVYQAFSKTIDGGKTWTPGTVPAGENYFFSYIFALSDSVAWVTMIDNVALPHVGRIFKTIDGGNNWVVQFGDSAEFQGRFNFVYFWDENEGLTVGDHGLAGRIEIFKTFNGGDSWSIIPPENIPETDLSNGAEQPTHGNYWVAGDSTVWFSTDRGRVFRTRNRGRTWSVASTGLGSSYVYATFQDELTGLATAPLESKNIAKTTDGGDTWAILPYTLPKNALLFHVNGTDSTYMYFTAEVGKLLGTEEGYGFTNDYGKTYAQEGDIPFNGVTFVNDSIGWMGNSDNNKIYKWTGQILTFIEAISTGYSPKSFTLSQNYPNPFNPSTIISYSIPYSGFVTLKIYDLSGREIQTLVNQNQSAGEYSTSFDGSGLASGIYIYKLKAADFEQSRKMLLLR